MGWFVKILIATAGLGGVGLALLYALQEKMIYVPRIPGMVLSMDSPDKYGLQYKDCHFAAKDGTQLHGWFLYPHSKTPKEAAAGSTIVFFQENAGTMSMRLPFLRDLIRLSGCSIFAPSYRGYGHSSGTPSEQGLQQDAQAALDYVLKEKGGKGKVALLGKSLGGAVAIYLAAARHEALQAVIVENTFTSLEEMAPKVLPFLRLLVGRGRPANWLLRNKWNSLEAVQRIRDTPLLLMSSLQDEMLPPVMMRELFQAVEAAHLTPCTWVEFEHAHHMDAHIVAQQEYWPALLQFLQKHQLSEAPGPLKAGDAGGIDSDDSWSHGGLDSGDEAAGAQAVAAGEQHAGPVHRRGGVKAQHVEP